jgi:hypothetical protein
MKRFILSLALTVLLAAGAFAQTQTLALTTTGTSNTSGSFTKGTPFSLDVSLTFSGYTGDGLSYWLQVPTALAPYITITSEQYFTFTDPTNTGAKTFVSSAGANSGFSSDQGSSNSGDLGGTATNSSSDVASGTYQVTTLNFLLSASAPVGTYSIRTTTLSPRTSEANDNAFATHSIPGVSYSLNVSPEPSTVAFLLGGAGLLATRFFLRKQKA